MAAPKLEIDIAEVERLAGLGLTQEEIAESLGISERTLRRRKGDMSILSAAIKRGKTAAGREVANALYQKAISGDVGAIVWWEKTRRGMSDKQKIEHSGSIDVRQLSDDELRAIIES